MEKKAKPEIPDAFLWLNDVPEPSAPERFDGEQMIACDACGRKNPPTRMACLYCGAKLDVSLENANLVRPVLRKLESWEKGWNVVLLPDEKSVLTGENAKKIAEFLRFETNEIEKISDLKHALPLARAESSEEAAVIEKFLHENNLAAKIVSDEALAVETPQQRVRTIEFGENHFNLRLSGSAETIEGINYSEITLFVPGVLYERQVESTERRKGEERFEIKDSRETSSDESVLDFYLSKQQTGYRIIARSFDFSCLGAEKKMLAGESYELLLDKLKNLATNAAFENSYKQARGLLNLAWPLDERSESLGWQREGLGKVSFENRLTVSNANQFLRYSRMLHELLLSAAKIN